MIGKGKRRRPKTKIVTEDEQGRVIDLHALRTKLGTNLAREGIAPQVAQQIMRHGDYHTTLKHYTVLGLNDTSVAIEKLPSIAPVNQAIATGTHDATVPGDPRQYNHKSTRSTATHREARGDSSADADDNKPSADNSSCHDSQGIAKICQRPAGVAQLVERQLPKWWTGFAMIVSS